MSDLALKEFRRSKHGGLPSLGIALDLPAEGNDVPRLRDHQITQVGLLFVQSQVEGAILIDPELQRVQDLPNIFFPQPVEEFPDPLGRSYIGVQDDDLVAMITLGDGPFRFRGTRGELDGLGDLLLVLGSLREGSEAERMEGHRTWKAHSP